VDGELTEIASLAGVSNHRIGQDFISGGVRDCGTGPEMIVGSGDWREVVAVRYEDGALVPEVVGALKGPASFEAALACN
jgi:hypothetical protein